MTAPIELQMVTRKAWRAWLAKHHRDHPAGVWLVFHKRTTGRATLDYEAAVEEALCHGWIDSTIKRLDETRFARRFTPRRPGSQWSMINQARVERLVAAGQMHPVGLAEVALAQRAGTWNADPRPPIGVDPPADLIVALARNAKAQAAFDRAAPGCRREYLRWIADAKRPEPRARRIQETVERLATGQRLGMK